MSIEIQNIGRADPSVTVQVLMEMIKQKYGYTVKYRRVWQAKRKALVAVFGDWEKSYNELPTVTSIDRETQTFEVHTGISMISPYKGQYTQHTLMNATCRTSNDVMPVDSIQSNTQIIDLSYHSSKFPNTNLLKGPDRPRTTRIHNEMVRLAFDYCTSRALETRDSHISHACRECTITLQDVVVQLGLPVDGEPLTGSLRYNWMLICNDYLGVVPPDMKGQQLSLPWLAQQFEELPPDANIVNVQRYARAYIMQLIRGFLFADKSNTLVHCMFLQFLFDFDQAENTAAFRWLTFEFQVNWTPYTSDIMASLPVRCHSDQAIWTYIVDACDVDDDSKAMMS
ncbi:serine/threonine-protein phosphatase 7 long form-like protein [Cucumis melo var. makuwa]|uniref:Serine/threonine-protein phosphatase 7 long form-like protein n=1 Tax=Cucumis melo var. makuwa TaxID=1194695 RepID=A0A5D3C1Y3_CUCMM|nr:serine/threonine-protein phosphatase 7 long form-like protein [Cucumis melo var. makuwa]TYK05370.1 serine/threonine-protein phosphatase 7 long form-like protein [Cucumis melo var. makuwa]